MTRTRRCSECGNREDETDSGIEYDPHSGELMCDGCKFRRRLTGSDGAPRRPGPGGRSYPY